eukprot:167112-Amphidinium_carterae.1
MNPLLRRRAALPDLDQCWEQRGEVTVFKLHHPSSQNLKWTMVQKLPYDTARAELGNEVEECGDMKAS